MTSTSIGPAFRRPRLRQRLLRSAPPVVHTALPMLKIASSCNVNLQKPLLFINGFVACRDAGTIWYGRYVIVVVRRAIATPRTINSAVHVGGHSFIPTRVPS